ncbi:autotransporter domain-containing protein [Mesorhizobium sp.]|uniref:autotransporter domain-containing protein n=1 Tax=Mesorhizobium sp. TaxID=1871066 RepID=UPI003BABA470
MISRFESSVASGKKALLGSVSSTSMVAALVAGAIILALAASPSHAGGGGGGENPPGGAGGQDSVTGAGQDGGNSSAGGWAGGGGGAGIIGGNGGAGSINAFPGGAGGLTPGADGAAATSGDGGRGGGGGGAHGYVGATLPTSATAGGKGGDGGGNSGTASADAGGGGAGGYGAVITGSGDLATLTQQVSGGNGGNGGETAISAVDAYGGGGGSGGNGLVMTASGAALTIATTVSGGNGGNAGQASAAANRRAKAGNGGIGLSGNGLSVTIASGASVLGGNGGVKDPNDPGITNVGTGGVAISGSGLKIINAGTIKGGLSGNGVQASAINFTGGVNSLTIAGSSVIQGKVSAFSAADTFGLGGSANASFDLSRLGASGSGAQYEGFGILEKSGSSIWTVSGTPGTVMAWSVKEGTLDLGATTQTATGFKLTGGELSNGTLSSSGSFDLSAGTVSAVLAGTGGLHKIGSGTVTLSGVNTYTGGTTIDGGGTLALSGAGSIASSSGVIVSGTLDISATTDGASIKTLTGGGKVVLGAKTLTVSAASGSFVNVIEGAGGLTIAGGTQKLDGMNTYTGKTTIDSGATLALTGQGRVNASSGVEVNGTFDISASVGAQIKALTGSGAVELGDKSLIITAASGTFSGAIHGTAGISVSSGTQILTGANDFSGGAGISSGATLQIGDGGTVGSLTSNVTNYGTLAFKRSDEVTYAGTITGPGGVTVGGGGTFIFTGANSGGNNATIASGTTLQLGNGGTTGWIGGVGNFAGTITNDGALIYNRSNAVTWKGVFSGSGTIEQAGGNSLTLTGDSSGFTGSTTVSSGSLIVGVAGAGKLGGDIEVKSGARLGGSGTIGGDVTIASGGTHGVGNSIGSQTVGGDYTNHGIFEVEGSPTAADKLVVGGTVDITGAKLKLALSPTTPASWSVLNGPYTIIDNQGSSAVIGEFDVSPLNNLIFLDHLLNYQGGDGNDVMLSLIRNDIDIADIAETSNQEATAQAIDGLGTGNPLAFAMLMLSNEDAARQALDALSGEMHAAAKGMLVQDSHYVSDMATARIRSALDEVAAPALPVMAYGEGGPELVAANTQRFAVWGQAFGSWGRIDGNANAAGLDRSTGGFIAGADGAVGDAWRIGVLAGYSHSSFDADNDASSGSSDNYHLGVYGGGRWGAFGVRAGAAYSWHSIQTDRTVGFPGFDDALSANYDAGTTQLFGEAGYRIESPIAAFEPFANLTYVNLHTDGFAESGGAAALTSAASNNSVTFSTLGVRASTDVSLGGLPATVRGTLGWRHAFGDITPTSSVNFTGSDVFSVAGAPIAVDAMLVEAGIDFAVSETAKFGLTYSGQFGSRSSDNGFNAKFGLAF